MQEPSLYFGELSNDYVIVRTRTREFHYPRGDENVYTQYAGSGGLALESLGRRLLFALRFGAYQIAFNDDITAESRILFHRNIAERVAEIAPFLTFDRDPYLVLADGRLYWMYDAYTTSDRYPYSTPAGGGSTTSATRSRSSSTPTTARRRSTRPMRRTRSLATYARRVPGHVQAARRDAGGAARAPPLSRKTSSRIQASVFATYHMTRAGGVLQPRRSVGGADDRRQRTTRRRCSRTTRSCGCRARRDAEFIQMLPFTPRRKDNLAAWLVARSDPAHYGDVRVFQFPKQKVVFGPRQVVARINQDQMISPQITLWNQQGSQVMWGTLMVIPIEESLIYVRPLYLRGAGGRIPELKRVVVVYQNQIVMEQTLEAALARLFGGNGRPARTAERRHATAADQQPGARSAGGSARQPLHRRSVAALAAEAQAHYQRAIDAQRAGDWAQYGEEIKALGQAARQDEAR